ncbi:unannotated protein [freshwater metagenome]|uniref:Unannotated protein n=1 Tax=freshwater metagenome TaxID=449393 RepID=A0A6J6ULY7_9ZZZZ
MSFARDAILRDEGKLYLARPQSRSHGDMGTFLLTCDSATMPSVVDALHLSLTYGSRYPQPPYGAQPLFAHAVKVVLREHRIAYDFIEGKLIEKESQELHHDVVVPILRLVSGRSWWEPVESAHQDALGELGRGDTLRVLTSRRSRVTSCLTYMDTARLRSRARQRANTHRVSAFRVPVPCALIYLCAVSESLSEQAYRRIRRLICTAELAPGSVISEAELGQQLSLGRTPVREALRTLAAEHLIDIYPRRGMFVAGVDPRNLRALSEVRERLEPFAAGLAAQRRDDDDVREIDALLAAIDTLGSEVDPGHLIELDERIHQCIYRCTHNPYLASDLDRYYAHALRIWFLALPTITHLQDAVVEHRELLDAVRCQDADRATTVMSKHVNEFEAEMRRAL